MIEGDGTSAAIAAASVIAKVTRDRYMHGAAARPPRLGLRGARRLLDPRAPRGDRADRHLAAAPPLVPVGRLLPARARPAPAISAAAPASSVRVDCLVRTRLDVLVGDAAAAVEGDADGVEADLRRKRGSRRGRSRHPGCGEAPDPALLARGRRRGPGARGRRSSPARPALTSTKTSVRAVEGDDVELAVAGAGVALDDLPAWRSQPGGDEVLGGAGRAAVVPAVIAPSARAVRRDPACAPVEKLARCSTGQLARHARACGAPSVGRVLATAQTFTLDGISARPVRVEVDVHRGLPAFSVVGLPDAAVREARERVRAALVNCGFEFPLRRIVANLAPASLRKAGPGIDLAIAAALLAASGQLELGAARRAWRWPASWRSTARSARCRARWRWPRRRRELGAEAIVVPAENGPEAALVDGIEVIAAREPRAAAGAGRGRVDARAAAAPAAGSMPPVRGAPTSPTCAASATSATRSRSRPPAATAC